MTSINTNISAYYAQNNLRAAGSMAQSSIAKLSSGNRIIKASDDVAALSIGTILRTNVSTLKTALTNANQGSTLLQIADGGLARVGEILQRQKALATQSNSGTVSANEKGYLNQEFQKLKSELDRIVDTTNFNGTKLINGGLFDGAKITSDLDKALTASVAAAGVTFTIAAQPTNGQTINVNGVAVTFTTATDRPDQVLIGTAAADTANNLANFLNNSTDGRLNMARYSVAGAVVTATYTGGRSDNTVNFGFTAGTYVAGTIVGTSFAATTTTTGDMNARTSAVGTVGDSILNNINQQGTLAANNLAGIDTSGLRNNRDFLGEISGFKVEYIAANTVNISIKVGDVTYSSGSVSTAAAATVTMTGVHSDADFETTFDTGLFTMRTSALVTVANQTDADAMASRLDQAFSTVSMVQSRDVTSALGQGSYTTGGVLTANMAQLRVDMRSDNFNGVQVSDIKVAAPIIAGGNASVEMTINGEKYINSNNLGDRIATNGMIIMTNIDDPKKSLTIQMGSTALPTFAATAAVVRTDAEAKTFEDALKASFGVGKGGSALEFQVGTDSKDTIGIAITGVDTDSLYVDDAGVAVNMDLVNGDINTIQTALDNAIKTVTSRRADVGALQSRFGYAAASLEVSVQNLDAARGQFLDADISEESTAFARAQVLQQAAISVLAQANQIPQNLLKLIG